MKKVLFTLAALLSLGFAANAGNLHPGEYLPDAPTIVFGDLEGNEISEITLAPGESQELSFILKQMNSTMISGFGIQWRMFDANHNPINYAADAVVQCAKVYGSRTKFWFNPVGIGTNDPNQGGYNGVSLANATPYDNVYRILATNTVENMIFFAETEDGQPTCPAVFGHYTVKVADGWTDDFATFELDTNYSLFNSCPDYDPNDYWESVYPADLDMKLTIKNANATPPTPAQVADPVVTFTEDGDVLTVSWTCETEGATLVIGENEYALPYSYTVERTYEDQVINGTAYAKKDGMENSNEVPFNYTFTAKTQPTATEPVIEFAEDGSGVMITVENATEFTVTVDGTQVYPTRDGAYYVEKVYDRAQAITVYAKNDPGFPYIAVDTTATMTLEAKAKAKNSTPSLTYTYDNVAGTITVSAYGCTEDDVVYTLIGPDGVEHESPYTFNYNTAEGYDAFWTATAVSPTTTVSDACAPYEVIVEAVLPDTPAPVVTIDDDSDPTTITAVGQGTVTIYVNGVPATSGEGTVTYEIPWGAEETYVTVYAVAHVENQNDGVSGTQYAFVGKAETPITEVGAPTFSGYTIDGITGYGVYIIPTTPGSSIKYRVFTYNEETGEYDIPVTDGWMDYTGTEGEIYYTDMGGKYRVEAYAYIEDVQSDPVSYEFVVHVPTGINEMMGGKTIASQRFFNMAGQEMQEANGVTIVVTTYTEGTSSAVKVMM